MSAEPQALKPRGLHAQPKRGKPECCNEARSFPQRGRVLSSGLVSHFGKVITRHPKPENRGLSGVPYSGVLLRRIQFGV